MNEVRLKRSSACTPNKAEFLKSVRSFFEIQTETQLELAQCGLCGASMSRCEVDFWLFGGERCWKLQLPYCEICNPPHSR